MPGRIGAPVRWVRVGRGGSGPCSAGCTFGGMGQVGAPVCGVHVGQGEAGRSVPRSVGCVSGRAVRSYSQPPLQEQCPCWSNNRCCFRNFGTLKFGGSFLWWSLDIKFLLLFGAGDGILGMLIIVLPPTFIPSGPLEVEIRGSRDN